MGQKSSKKNFVKRKTHCLYSNEYVLTETNDPEYEIIYHRCSWGEYYTVYCLLCDHIMFTQNVDWDRAKCVYCKKTSSNKLYLNSLTKVSKVEAFPDILEEIK